MLVTLGILSLAESLLVFLFFVGAGCHRDGDLDSELVEQADILRQAPCRRA